MSGLSTKTSHALFTISSIFQTAKDKKVAALMFNVKGADLLYLDKPVEVDSKDDPELAARYEKADQRASRPRTGRCTRRSASRWNRSGTSPSSRRSPTDRTRRRHGLSVGHTGEQAEHPAHRARRGHQRAPHSVGPRGRVAARRADLRSHGLRRQVPRLRRA